MTKLHLSQERMDLQREVTTAGSHTGDIGDLEASFIEAARTYGERKGITTMPGGPSASSPESSRLPGSGGRNSSYRQPPAVMRGLRAIRQALRVDRSVAGRGISRSVRSPPLGRGSLISRRRSGCTDQAERTRSLRTAAQ